MKIVVTTNPSPADVDFLRQQIKDFNDAHSPQHRAARSKGPTQLGFFLRSAENEIMGGLLALIYWNWLYIDELWLHESIRGRGFGTQLIQRAEVEARARGCQHAQVKTFAFQAPDFYVQMGYVIVGRMEDFPPGQSFYWLRKELT